ncbi:Eukaryotic translation initiation factor 3 110 kDa subunit [Nitrospina watsonii]|uniref:Eukaryotic translation initiation factor 3 110 kDa subunit n=2 Tax=Nitrospina watsonii TaxID=1323948 RepID=A0ABM9HEW4_9BACT|nr:Eukaryotic translation initiation factor 3 110 kDa subunit [Nitrospina watsonii]
MWVWLRGTAQEFFKILQNKTHLICKSESNHEKAIGMLMSPEEEQKARENLRILSELREKTELLSEHVENRKQGLEEEIEESLHEAIRNARDSLEKISENIEPKLQNTIQERLDVLRQQMDDWKYDAREMVKEEIEKKSGAMNQKLLDALDARLQQKVDATLDAVKTAAQDEMKTELVAQIDTVRKETEAKLASLKTWALAGAGLSAVALLAAAMVWFVR